MPQKSNVEQVRSGARERERGSGLVWDFDNGMNAKYFWWGCSIFLLLLSLSFALPAFSATAFWHISFSIAGNKFYNKIYYVLPPRRCWHKQGPCRTTSFAAHLEVTWYVFPLSISDLYGVCRDAKIIYLMCIESKRDNVSPPGSWSGPRLGVIPGIRPDSSGPDRDEVLWCMKLMCHTLLIVSDIDW